MTAKILLQKDSDAAAIVLLSGKLGEVDVVNAAKVDGDNF